MSRRLRVLVWHLHGAYLLYLTRGRHTYYVPSRPERSGDYIGRWGHLPWGPNVVDVPADEVRRLPLDCIVYQTPGQYAEESRKILSPEQRRLPRVYLEHEPPHEHATERRHWVADDPDVLLVHVTHFNRLMWDNGRAPTAVVEHGVPEPPVRWRGDLARGVSAVN
ncbi:MAG TPA: glycosyltransferase family 1 protein, partial [Elusimicrobiota bacterium]|nr:glycosyltransferase family 1 protein [Elusimicrobiota bacterium]